MEQKACQALLEDATHLNRIHLPQDIDALYILIDPFELDNVTWEGITESLNSMLSPEIEVILELFTYDNSPTVIWPTPPRVMIGPVSVMHRQPYHLAAYTTRTMKKEVVKCCSSLGWDNI